MRNEIKSELIAPCGMNCAVCAAYLAKKNKLREQGLKIIICDGCRIRNKQCAYLRKWCANLSKNKVQFCYQCAQFPCSRLQTIDKRYRERYRMSLIGNLRDIKSHGINKFLAQQEKKWRCKKCQGMVCCHNGLCFTCDFEKLQAKKKRYRWGE